ncbi:MAG: lysylphosphatidylglycerol synthase transmembrane domain-containing protein [Bacteroidota bacterium]
MKRNLRASLKYSISFLLTLFFLYLAFRGTDWEQLGVALRDAKYVWILLMVPCILISHGFRALRWRILLQPIKSEISLHNLFSAVMVGYMVNNLIPRAGELARPYTLGRRENISKTAAFGTVVVERILDVWTFLFLLVLFLVFYRGPLFESFPWLTEVGLVGAVSTVGMLVVFLLFMIRRERGLKILRLAIRPLPIGFATRLEKMFLSFLDGFLFVKDPRRYFAIAMLSLVIWAWYILMLYLPFFGFGLVDLYSLDLYSAAILVVVTSVGVMVPTPGATGTYHSFATETLVRLYDVDRTLALSYATATHAVGYLAITIVGLLYFFREHANIKEAMRGQVSPEGTRLSEDPSRGGT